jgi:hypothetical protein
MDEAVRQLVRDRAEHRCEYCRLSQRHLPYSTFQVEHVRPRKHGGSDEPENLALACERCNAFKGPNLTGIDPQTQQVVQLFNPRRDQWLEHFERRGHLMLGTTAIGRTTVEVLNMNESSRVKLRRELLDQGEEL